MTWASILAGLAKLAGLVMTYINNRQLLDAGEAKATAKFTGDALEKVNEANRARITAADDGVFRDPFDRANGRSVPSVPTDRLRQPGDTA